MPQPLNTHMANKVPTPAQLILALILVEKIILNIDNLILQVPAFIKATGPKVPTSFQKDANAFLSSNQKILLTVRFLLTKAGLKTTVKPFTTRQQWLVDLTSVRNDVVFLDAYLNGIGINTGISPKALQDQIDLFIKTYIFPYIK